MRQQAIPHGGALIAAMRSFPDAPRPWIDLSTGINPVPWPVPALAREVWQRLPEREEIAELEAIAARAYGVPPGLAVVAAAGAQTLIEMLPRVVPAKSVAIAGSTYAEHESRWRMAGANTRVVTSLGEAQDADVCVVVNPNNPDGRLLTPSELKSWTKDALLVVDESFMDVAPADMSFVPHLGDARTIVLRSFGKFFGLAGVRLGFAITATALAERLRAALGPWPVSGPAIAIGRAALADEAWQARSLQRLAIDAARLDDLLTQSGLQAAGGTALFRLATHPRANALHAQLCRAGILVRAFPDRPEALRFGLPGDEDAWQRLAKALATF